MTLADSFMLQAQNKRLDSFSLGQVQGVARDLERAQKFVMSPEVREACRDFMTMKPSSLLEACSYARPPFPMTWLEWPAYNGPTLKSEFVMMPKKIGAMITDLGDGKFKFYTAWNYETVDKSLPVAGLSDSAFEVGVDFVQPSVTFPGWYQLHGVDVMNDEQIAADRDDKHNSIRHILGNPFEKQAYISIEAALRIGPRLTKTAATQARLAAAMGKQSMQALYDDVREEIGPVIAMLILLNARNGVERTAFIPSPRLQRSRVKNGKPPLVEYSTVEIRLSRALREAAKAGTMSHAAAKGHVVKGHFKVRRSGVYWWSSHLRGDFGAGEVRRSKYEVTK